MRLQPATGAPFSAICIKCQQFKPVKVADLDGPAFKAYYCAECEPTDEQRPCPNCGQWARADSAGRWDCLNECNKRGFVAVTEGRETNDADNHD